MGTHITYFSILLKISPIGNRQHISIIIISFSLSAMLLSIGTEAQTGVTKHSIKPSIPITETAAVFCTCNEAAGFLWSVSCRLATAAQG